MSSDTDHVDCPRPVADDKGRFPVLSMTDRELLEEMVTTTRATRDLVESFIADFANNPMMGSLMRMFGGRK